MGHGARSQSGVSQNQKRNYKDSRMVFVLVYTHFNCSRYWIIQQILRRIAWRCHIKKTHLQGADQRTKSRPEHGRVSDVLRPGRPSQRSGSHLDAADRIAFDRIQAFDPFQFVEFIASESIPLQFFVPLFQRRFESHHGVLRSRMPRPVHTLRRGAFPAVEQARQIDPDQSAAARNGAR